MLKKPYPDNSCVVSCVLCKLSEMKTNYRENIWVPCPIIFPKALVLKCEWFSRIEYRLFVTDCRCYKEPLFRGYSHSGTSRAYFSLPPWVGLHISGTFEERPLDVWKLYSKLKVSTILLSLPFWNAANAKNVPLAGIESHPNPKITERWEKRLPLKGRRADLLSRQL